MRQREIGEIETERDSERLRQREIGEIETERDRRD